ncbi:MAG TPA: flavin reductase family protein [Caulobacteraceae bacterium]|nr:flavin reductase family protein [Caulobacteraceae bacterium]
MDSRPSASLDPAALQPLSPVEWRLAMGRFPTGVTVVTSWKGPEPVGTTANALASVSLEPPLLLVCLDLKNPALAPIEACGVFGVNMLASDHLHLVRRFSQPPEENRFEGLAWRSAPGGAPELPDTAVFVDCALAQVHLAGDHKIIVGRGVRVSHNSDAGPLLYHKGAFPKLPFGWGEGI